MGIHPTPLLSLSSPVGVDKGMDYPHHACVLNEQKVECFAAAKTISVLCGKGWATSGPCEGTVMLTPDDP